MGLIYRAEYLVNWSPGLQTAVSDLEVEYSEEQGFLYHFNYPVKGGGSLPVATTRPETILGDTAVAVHPDDERYQQYIGKTALVPMLNREIPIIADEYVDMSFGTGALKITPGHDPNDFEIGKRHGLAIVNVMNKDATMNDNAGPYAGWSASPAAKSCGPTWKRPG
jgi:valyl-tRNA synthetase